MKGEKLSNWKLFILGFQHVCVMYGGAIAVPLIVGPAIGLTQEQLIYLISFDLFACGVATLIQVIGGNGFGIRLPAMMAVSFIVVEPIIAIGSIHSLQGVFGAVIVSGIVVVIFSQLVSKIIPYFPPIVTGSIVLIIGISLMPVAMRYAAGGSGASDFGSYENLGLALLTVFIFFISNTFLKGFFRSISVLIAMFVGSIVAFFLGEVDAGIINEAEWFMPITPFYFGLPTFQLSSILIMSVIAIIIMIESVGVFLALGEICEEEIGQNEVRKGLRAEGLAALISGIFNSFNHSTFSQNVGLVYLTKVTNRYVVVTAGFILITIGIIPKIAAITTMIPPSVLGGAMVPMFGMLISAALRMLSKADLTKSSNQITVALGIGGGLAIKAVPDAFILFPETIRLLVSNGVVMGTLILFILNLLLNGKEKNRKAGKRNLKYSA